MDHLEAMLRADPTSARQARKTTVSFLLDHGIDGEVNDSAALVVSELVSNAIVHAADRVNVGVAITERVLRIEVTDPQRLAQWFVAAPKPDREWNGRGLRIIEAVASRWGAVHNADNGKTVWAELLIPEH